MKRDEIPDLDCEVLIVGAGPTGLMAATLLHRQGVRVRIIDTRTEPSTESRAFAIQARTMELFQSLGLVDQLLDKGVVNPGIDMYIAGQPVGGMDYDRAGATDTPYPFIFLLPQSETEAILIAELSRQGIAVERGLTVIEFSQTAEYVVTRAQGANGLMDIKSAYLIGADGAHSMVRKASGMSFDGAKYAQTFMLADCRIEWPLDHSRFKVFVSGDTIGLFLPIAGETCSRVMATDHGPGNDSTEAPLELAELESAFRKASGLDVRLSDAVWKTRYKAHHRAVDRYREGRAFVAGDAAHIHSPAGGQGMNTGLQDAANLAWKIAGVLKHGMPLELLDSYDAERRPIAQQVVKTSDRMFTAVAGQSGLAAKLRDWTMKPAARALFRLRAVQRKAFRTLSEIDITYAPTQYGADEAPGLGDHGPRPGQRAPNAAIARHCDVFDLIGGYTFSVLAISRKPLEKLALDEAARALAGIETGAVKTHLVTRQAHGRDPRAVFVESADVFEAYGLRKQDAQAVFVVRPDGYVMWGSNGLNIKGCQAFLSRLGLAG